MKRLFTILAALALVILCATLLPTEAQAAEIVKSGTCGTNLTWTLDDEGTLTISGTGAMRNYKYDGSVNCEGPYYKFDVDNIIYKQERGYKEYDHLNRDIVDLKPGKYYEYVRYINSLVDIKPLTWVLLGFDYTRITGRIIDDEYPKWTLVMLGNELEQDEDLREDKIIAIHNGLYFTYLFENEGSYKIKLEMKDINGNEYEIEKFIVIVDKDANYEMYHTLKDEYDKYKKLFYSKSSPFEAITFLYQSISGLIVLEPPITKSTRLFLAHTSTSKPSTLQASPFSGSFAPTSISRFS